MALVLALILGPLAVAVCLAFTRSESLRRILVIGTGAAVSIGSLYLAIRPVSLGSTELPVPIHSIDLGMLAAELALGLYVFWVGLRARQPLIVALIVAQLGAMLWLESQTGEGNAPAQPLFLDDLAIIMALINGVVGSGICVYALGYMREYHETAHCDVPDRRPLFFALLFVFMGAMFGLIFANKLTWLFLFWEVTTLCSFLLIGYTQTDEARRNALRALVMNLAGGVAFAVAIVSFHSQTKGLELQALIHSPHGLVLFPAALLCFAGITKSAQLPFSSWLLGAMVAPTPVSALLHSSTMVKAGVYMVLRMAPVVTATRVGNLVALVGGITFLIASLAAITTSEAKRVLAYSTVANLGLIVLCGGIGTAEAVWAGILLIVFHAVAKCLLFLCVGMVEHKLHSRDIEVMSGLVVQMPQVAVMMLLGMAGMFLAPFGMLISKWAVLKAVVDASPTLSVFVVFGSSATLFFWTKWMGKLVEVMNSQERVRHELAPSEAVPLYGLALATVGACLFFPFLSAAYIEPYVRDLYGHAASLGEGNVIIMMLMMAMVLLFPLSFLRYGRGVRVVSAYLGGANRAKSSVVFTGSANQPQTAVTGNYYLQNFLSDSWLTRCGVITCASVQALMVVVALL